MNIKSDFKRERKRIVAVCMSVVLLICLCQILLTYNSNRKVAFDHMKMSLNQLEENLVANEIAEAGMVNSLKEDYAIKAGIAAYILSNNRIEEESIKDYRELASLISVDEINVFDSRGTIYAGTNPEYIGMNFDSGEQMAFFKPMLEDRSLTMCQDLEFNTAGSGEMMYAMAWREDGTSMVQVGVSPTELIETMKVNDISAVAAAITDEADAIQLIADSDDGRILGCTDAFYEGNYLADYGLVLNGLSVGDDHELVINFDGSRYYMLVRNIGSYYIIAGYRSFMVNDNLIVITGVLLALLLLAVLVVMFIFHALANDIYKISAAHVEHENKEKNVLYSNNTSKMIRGAFAYEDPMKGIEYIMREFSRSVNSEKAMVLIEDEKYGIELTTIEWSEDGSLDGNYVIRKSDELNLDGWYNNMVPDMDAELCDRNDIRKRSDKAYESLVENGIDYIAYAYLRDGKRLQGYMSVANPNTDMITGNEGMLQYLSIAISSLIRDYYLINK